MTSRLTRTTSAACLLLAATAPAFAARPMITDDARIVDAQSCQVESWLRRNRDHSTELWALPGCNPGGDAEITLGGGWQRSEGETRNTDRVLQAKTLWRTLQGDSAWAWGTALGAVDRPQAGGTDFYGYLPLTVKLVGERLFLHANLGLRRDGAERRNVTTSGLALEGQWSPRVWLVGETFVQDRGRPLYQLGVRFWVVPDRVQVDTTYGDRTGAGGNERWVSVGLRLLSPPFLP
jgi:hypothetical protein